MIRALLSTVAFVVVTGCASIGDAVDRYEWTLAHPPLPATVVTVPADEAIRLCSALTMQPAVACAARTAHHCVAIIPPDREDIRRHELKHCEGYVHP